MFKKANMEYRNLGNSGLRVSVLAYGNWLQEQSPLETAIAVIKKCLENGINYFDTAELYGRGQGEKLWGKVFAEINEPREKFVIASKVWKGDEIEINSDGATNRKHVKEGIKRSLANLQMEYLDVIYAHGYDEKTPLQQTCRAFHDAVQEGLVFYWGVSNWDVDQIFNAFQICEKFNLHKPIVGQNHYNMLVRNEVQDQYRKLFQKYGFGIAAYSPLEGGLLTGKYLNKEESQKSRFGDNAENIDQGLGKFLKFLHQINFNEEQITSALKELKKIAEQELSCKLTHLALAWVIKFKYTSTAIFGARNCQQIQDSLKALEVLPKITEQVQARINKIIGTNPEPRMDCRSWTPMANLRP